MTLLNSVFSIQDSPDKSRGMQPKRFMHGRMVPRGEIEVMRGFTGESEGGNERVSLVGGKANIIKEVELSSLVVSASPRVSTIISPSCLHTHTNHGPPHTITRKHGRSFPPSNISF
ncbi:hypothetical protein LSTR_LSTR015110 [Laodelphax striatellus]|uniref:Uncharacterized protein n=1 Tax=Laodelphax striatellus TaxID=195883 RepID=A0A482XJU4_LAOST|nr:hypothetical protein LSTR_LSTR015110 [Laodelphax striatellus]